MRAVIQRARGASVNIDSQRVAAFEGRGFVVLLGVEQSDTEADMLWLVRKVAAMRIFDDKAGVMNLSLKDIATATGGEEGNCIIVSQFTLYASTRKGNRPSWLRAATHDIAIPLYEAFIGHLTAELGRPVGHGEFGADMQVSLCNDGPVTIIIDSKMKE